MRLLGFHLKRKAWLLPLMMLWYLIFVFAQKYEEFSFYHKVSEEFPCMIAALTSAFILGSEAENEFAKGCGVSLFKLSFVQWLPHVVYPFLVATAACPLYWTLYQAGALHRYELPAEAVKYEALIFSLLVTLLAAASLVLFVRVLVRNVYFAVGAFTVAFACFFSLHEGLLKKSVPLASMRYDLFLTGLLYSEDYEVSEEVWLTNRLFFLGVAVVLLLATWLLGKQKYYENL